MNSYKTICFTLLIHLHFFLNELIVNEFILCYWIIYLINIFDQDDLDLVSLSIILLIILFAKISNLVSFKQYDDNLINYTLSIDYIKPI